METQLRLLSSAIALTAMVLIWNEAPIANSPSDHEGPRVAYSDRVEQSRADRDPDGRGPQGAADVVEGENTDVAPQAEPGRATGETPNVDR